MSCRKLHLLAGRTLLQSIGGFHMRKKIFLLITAFLAALTLCSCESVSGSNEEQTDSALSEEKTGWGPKLFEGPSTVFDYDLAFAAAEMSGKAEDTTGKPIEELYADWGIDDCKVYNYTSGMEVKGFELSLGGGAFAIGRDTLSIGGIDTTVLVITARGSTTAGEYIGDLWKGWYLDPDKVHSILNRTVWDNVYDFEELLWDGIEDYLRNVDVQTTGNLKILITGHSLGGAAANLLGARFTAGVGGDGWWGGKVTKDDIYVYTFEAIKVLTEEENVSAGYENIHNIYNYYDSFGPNGRMGFTSAGSPDAKFGHTDLYYLDEEQDGNQNSVANHVNYRSALEAGIIELACAEAGSMPVPPEAGPEDPPDVGQVTTSEFTIEGTWKNTGESTFGQAQSGSIITFDGTHCNYYSPCDTYALYFENGEWTLDCVSYIFAETLRFRVDVINEDTIDIYYGSEAVRLERISRDAETIEEPQETGGDFVIEGSWSSVGSEGFGQAQPGATVTFDGTHCNFFSPYDTYALYRDNGQWKLDCTSVLFSQTLTFTVEVLDADSINVYSSSICTELKRIG